MRKGSLQTQTSEPVIVVEEPVACVQEVERKTGTRSSSEHTSEEESPTMNPYLLSPWRDARETRKHSLPTPQCSGITASQVRRLSERGEGTPGPRQTEFLATLSSAPAPTPGGRRHSVVTISKVPSTLFGRNRRESVAAFPSSVFPGRILPSRRESVTGPPSTEPRGSVHNLQLDIMDDIVQARKVRMKLWNTSNEKVCEVQPLDETGGVQRYASSSVGRRYSDFVGTTLAPIPSSSKRRASELPPPSCLQPPQTTSSACKITSSGIVCTNTDLISILSSLTSSAMEINQQCEVPRGTSMAETAENRRGRLKTSRSNSFDISVLPSKDIDVPPPPPSNWFVKRHQPMSSKSAQPPCPKNQSAQATISFTNEKIPLKPIKSQEATGKDNQINNKVLWDERSGSLVDAQLLGNAIEDFLRRSSPEKTTTTTSVSISPSKGAIPKASNSNTSSSQSNVKPKGGWFSNKSESGTSAETCDSSLCSTLKDLFVK